jgi:hypothetical protein
MAAGFSHPALDRRAAWIICLTAFASYYWRQSVSIAIFSPGHTTASQLGWA